MNNLIIVSGGPFLGTAVAWFLSVVFLLTPLAARAEPLDLESYLNQVRQQHEGIKASSKSIESAGLKGTEANLVYAPSLFVNYAHVDDKNPQAAATSGVSYLTSDSVTTGVKQNFQTGTSASLSYTLSHTDLNGVNRRMMPEPDQYVEKPTVELRQPLLRNARGREFALGGKLAKTRTDSIVYGEQFKQTQILVEARAAYFRLAFARETVAIQSANLDRALKLRGWLKQRVDKHLADQADLIQAEAMVSLRTLDVEAARDDERVASRAFNMLRGTAVDEVDEPLPALSAPMLKSLVLPAKYKPKDDLKAAQAQVQQTILNADLAEEKNKPTLELFGNYSWGGHNTAAGDAAAKSLDNSRPTWSVGLAFNMILDRDLLAGLSRGYRMEAAAAEEGVMRKDFEQTEEWNNLITKYREAQKRLKLAVQLEKIQLQKMNYERDRHERGRTTLYQVLMFEQDYAQSRLTKLSKLYEVLGLYVQMSAFEGNLPSA